MIADSAEAKPAGARINPQAAAAKPIRVSNMARMAGLRPSVQSISAGSTGGGRRAFKGNSKTFTHVAGRRERPGRGGSGRAFLGSSQVLPYAGTGTRSFTGSSALRGAWSSTIVSSSNGSLPRARCSPCRGRWSWSTSRPVPWRPRYRRSW